MGGLDHVVFEMVCALMDAPYRGMAPWKSLALIRLPSVSPAHVIQTLCGLRVNAVCLSVLCVLQNSDDDLGSKDPKGIAVVGRWYGRMA